MINDNLSNEIFIKHPEYKMILSKKIEENEMLSDYSINDMTKKLNSVTGNQFIQFACELSCILHFESKKPNRIFYEPILNTDNNLNCECKYEFDDLELCIEVKAPVFDETDSEASMSFRFIEPADLNKKSYMDFVKKLEGNSNVDFKKMLNWRLHQYLDEANSKFGSESNESLNVLIVCLEKPSHFDEWYSYLSRKKGLFTPYPFIFDTYTDDEKKEFHHYKNVDMVMLTNTQFIHKNISQNVKISESAWDLDTCFNLCITNLFSRKFQDNEEEMVKKLTIFTEKYIKDYTSEFLEELDSYNEVEGYVRYAVECSGAQNLIKKLNDSGQIEFSEPL